MCILRDINSTIIGSERGNSGRAQDLFGWIFGLISEENSRFPGAIQVDQYNYYDRNNKIISSIERFMYLLP